MDGVTGHSPSLSKIPSLALTTVAYLFFWGVFDRMLHFPLPEGRLLVAIEKLVG